MFAFVGGTYFFLLGSLNFIARLMNVVITKVLQFMGKKTKPHVNKLKQRAVSIRKRGATIDKESSDEELLDGKQESLPSTSQSRNPPDLSEIIEIESS